MADSELTEEDWIMIMIELGRRFPVAKDKDVEREEIKSLFRGYWLLSLVFDGDNWEL